MSIIPEGYDIIAEGICTFSDSPNYYLGYWYHDDEEDIYYFLVRDGEEGEIYPVEEENMIRDDDDEVVGWFSKTMEEYTFVDLPETDDEYAPEAPEDSVPPSLDWGPQPDFGYAEDELTVDDSEEDY